MKFLSNEWIEEFESKARAVFSEDNTPSTLTVTLIECYENVPQLDGKDFWHLYDIEDGVIAELAHGYDKNEIPDAAAISEPHHLKNQMLPRLVAKRGQNFCAGCKLLGKDGNLLLHLHACSSLPFKHLNENYYNTLFGKMFIRKENRDG